MCFVEMRVSLTLRLLRVPRELVSVQKCVFVNPGIKDCSFLDSQDRAAEAVQPTAAWPRVARRSLAEGVPGAEQFAQPFTTVMYVNVENGVFGEFVAAEHAGRDNGATMFAVSEAVSRMWMKSHHPNYLQRSLRKVFQDALLTNGSLSRRAKGDVVQTSGDHSHRHGGLCVAMTSQSADRPVSKRVRQRVLSIELGASRSSVREVCLGAGGCRGESLLHKCPVQ